MMQSRWLKLLALSTSLLIPACLGEIGDICNGQQGTTVGGDGVTYVIQLEFSNAANNCVAR